MMDALEKYVRAAFLWMWICIGILLAYSSYNSFGAGIGALFFGIAFLFYGLRRLKNKKQKASNIGLKRIAVSLFSLGIVVVGLHGWQSFLQKHEANFAPLLVALEQYRNMTGEYPDEVTELVPQYVASLPECPVTAGWTGDSYYFKRKDGHRLQGTYIVQCVVGVFFFPQYGLYESDEAEWRYTD